MIRDDDIIRALGFVALYSAYVEESLDVLMDRLAIVKPISESERRVPASRKIKWWKKTLQSLGSTELDRLTYLLDDASKHLEMRNEVVHGRIYAGHQRTMELRSGRCNMPSREVTPNELYDLAENLFELQASIPHLKSFATLRAIAAAD